MTVCINFTANFPLCFLHTICQLLFVGAYIGVAYETPIKYHTFACIISNPTIIVL